MADSSRLKKIKSGVFSRGLALAKVSVAVGAKAASHAVGGLFSSPFSSDEEKAESLKRMIFDQVGMLSRELGQLKGSLMKAGQMLSMYGEHFLPPEANQVLKSLQSQSPPLDWPAIEKQLKRQLTEEQLTQVEIEKESLASASLGQVHRARRKSDGKLLAIKIQYPGVDKAIDSDISSLQSILSMSRLIPTGPRFDELFREVKSMLKQEVDYRKELVATDYFRNAFADDSRFIIPETVPELSTARVLTTSWEDGIPVDSPEVLALSQERRNAIGLAVLDAYFRELFELHHVQTDPHFGNYRLRMGISGAPDRLVMLDFGAVRKVPLSFITPYREMLQAALAQNEEGFLAAAKELGLLQEGDPEDLVRQFTDLCYAIVEPFFGRELLQGNFPKSAGLSKEFFDAQGVYDWGRTDLPKRVAKLGAKMIFSFRLRVPPRELVFLDRKMGGMFIFMHALRVKADAREILERHLI
jgi:predicted unusual protein kinase regulating ubiquinone biosynthesis (AarF/ABC1/UbiB family)